MDWHTKVPRIMTALLQLCYSSTLVLHQTFSYCSYHDPSVSNDAITARMKGGGCAVAQVHGHIEHGDAALIHTYCSPVREVTDFTRFR